ncbi:MAG: hypothetical protein IJF92_04550 [Bacilli bacterium]|nr:hypothetical protein [Bacilli bacterium]
MHTEGSFVGNILDNEDNIHLAGTILIKLDENEYVRLTDIEELKELRKYLMFYKFIKTELVQEKKDRYNELILTTNKEDNNLYIEESSLTKHLDKTAAKRLIKKNKEAMEYYKVSHYL